LTALRAERVALALSRHDLRAPTTLAARQRASVKVMARLAADDAAAASRHVRTARAAWD